MRADHALSAANAIKAIPTALKKTRERRNLTQREAAAEIGIVPATVNRIEAGHGCHSAVAERILRWIATN
jgi:DNA-binding XRE family transcriptional regulator